ncbi:hypothetical protein [Sulfuricurvum sp.]|uniref:hypothetical protein n=1 Tax=Sulfuricurvum sp. TaxID=2025608 RepID=UPI00286DBB49|nr:hypothetical protein [Sulfuricurvum sp.]
MEWLKSISAYLTNSPYLNLIFLLLAIISVIISIFLYFKSKKVKKPTYLYKSFALIKNSISALDGLQITYNKEQIHTLTLTKFAFWNNGNDVIDGNDIAPIDKLRISIPVDKKIINVKSIFNRKIANNISINIENNEAYINFDFLDFGDGAIFEVYHTADANEKINLNGTIKGVNKIKLGMYEKDFITNTIVAKLDNTFPEPENIIIKSFYIILIFPIVIPLFLITMSIDSFLSFINRIPVEYNLLNNKDENTD